MIILEWELEYWLCVKCGKEMVIIILQLLIFKLVKKKCQLNYQ